MFNDSELLFSLEITIAYQFRNFMSYLRNVNKEGNFIFTPDYIKYTEVDDKKMSINDVYFDKNDLNRYIFNSKGKVTVGVNLEEFENKTDGIGRRDGIRICLKKDKDSINQLWIYILRQNGNPTASFITVKNVAINEEECPIILRKEPNVVTPIGNFIRIFKNIADIKSEYVVIQGYPNGILLQAYLNCKSNGTFEEIGETPIMRSDNKIQMPDLKTIEGMNTKEKKRINIVIKPEENIPNVIVTSEVLKNISKISNISAPIANVKIYIEKDNPMKIVCPIGFFGQLTIYVQNNENEG